jgi:hypothetical protein
MYSYVVQQAAHLTNWRYTENGQVRHKYRFVLYLRTQLLHILKKALKLSEYKLNLRTVLWSRSTKSGSRLFADPAKTASTVEGNTRSMRTTL